MPDKGDANNKELDGAELEKLLKEKKFEHPLARLIGMVKSSTETGSVHFAPSGCHSRVDIPIDMIEKAEFVGHQPCKHHSHPLFLLTLKEQADPKAQVLLRLLGARGAQFVSTGASPQMPGHAAQPFAANVGGAQGLGVRPQLAARPQCDSWCAGSTLICACTTYISRGSEPSPRYFRAGAASTTPSISGPSRSSPRSPESRSPIVSQ